MTTHSIIITIPLIDLPRDTAIFLGVFIGSQIGRRMKGIPGDFVGGLVGAVPGILMTIAFHL